MSETVLSINPPIKEAGAGIVYQIRPPTLLEEALMYLLLDADLAMRCRNPECLAPYFFAKRRS